MAFNPFEEQPEINHDDEETIIDISDQNKISDTMDINNLEGEEEPSHLELNKSIDTITGHYYKNRIVRFRCSHKDYNLTTILNIDDLKSSPEILKSYLSKLKTKALSTLIRRHSELLIYLKKDTSQ